jgi:hypothetical protein
MIGAILGGLASIIGGKSAADAQKASANKSLKLQKQVYEKTYADYSPYRDFGKNALGAYSYEMGLGPKPANYTGFTETPGYQWQLGQGQDAINAQAGARGGLVSGRTLQDLSTYNQGLASQEYNNWLARIAGGVDTGMNASGAAAQAGQSYANGAANSLAARGNASAAGSIGMANAFNDTIGNIAGLSMYQKAMGQPGSSFGNWLSGF